MAHFYYHNHSRALFWNRSNWKIAKFIVGAFCFQTLYWSGNAGKSAKFIIIKPAKRTILLILKKKKNILSAFKKRCEKVIYLYSSKFTKYYLYYRRSYSNIRRDFASTWIENSTPRVVGEISDRYIVDTTKQLLKQNT